MKYIDIKDVESHLGQEISIRAWVRNIRHSGKLLFIILRDGSGELQSVAFKPDLGDEKFETARKLSMESYVIVTGIPKAHPKMEGEFELSITDVQPWQIAEDYPISKKEHGPDFLLSNRHLWLRVPKQWALMRLRHTIYFAICEYLNDNDYIRFDSPILTPSSCEGTTTLFELDYFDEGKAYLSQRGSFTLKQAS